MEQSVSFQTGTKVLRGIIHRPDKLCGKLPAIVLCHGFIGNKIGMHRIFVKAARTFCEAGYLVLRFDYSGCGDSDGDYSEITIDGQVNETLAAIEFLRRAEPQTDKIFLLGHSMGGAVAALTAEIAAKELNGLILWAPVANMYNDILGIVGNQIFDSVWQSGIDEYMGFGLGRGFLKSLQRNNPLVAANHYSGPVLLVHGTGDDEISYKNADLYKEKRRGLPFKTEIHLVLDADHTFSSLFWEKDLFQVTRKWMENPYNNFNIDFYESGVLTG